MAKALVIKSADFSENKLTTVELEEIIPCAGISLSHNTVSVSSFAPVTIIATVIPSDCTEKITWGSSDEDVVTVTNGVVTPLGLGTATITAICGAFSAICTVTVDNVEIDSGFMWGSLYAAGTNDYATANVPSKYKTVCYSDEIPIDSARLRYARASSFVGDFNLAPSMLPHGVGSLSLESTNVSGVYYVLFYNSKQSANNQPVVAKQVEKNAPSAPSNGVINSAYNIPADADAFGISITYKTQYTDEDDVDTIIASNATKIVLHHVAVN